MPNINEFESQCQALGLQHIEVVEGPRDSSVTLEDILSGRYARITTGTYEYFEDDLEKTDIVFFSQSDKTQEVSFIGNAVFFTESGGGTDESWTYETHKLTIPINGGVRTFNESLKDELIASGIIGIVADSIDERVDPNNENSDYKATSLFGKIEQKLAALKGNKSSLANVKVPWLYNMVIFNDSYLNGLHPEIYSEAVADGQNRNALENTTSGNIPFFCAPYLMQTNNYIYGFQTLNYNGTASYRDTITSAMLKEVYSSWMTKNPVKHIDSNSSGPFVSSNYTYLDWCITNCSETRTTSGYKAIKGRATSTSSAPNVNPIEAPYHMHGGSYNGYHSTIYGYTQDGYATVAFSEQPFLYGFVFYITEIHASDENPFLGGYLTIVGINSQGKIIKPKVPWYASEPFDYIDNGVLVTKTAGVYYDLIASNIRQASGSSTIPEIIPDNSEYSPLKGKILFECSVRQTPAEANYANNLNYIIAPDDFIPDDYFDDVP